MNKNKNKKYDEDPRCFWNDREARDTFRRFWLALLYLFSPFYLPLQVVSDHSVEWGWWLRIGWLLLQLTMLTSA